MRLTVADLGRYLALIEQERERRPSEAMLADEILRWRRLADQLAKSLHQYHDYHDGEYDDPKSWHINCDDCALLDCFEAARAEIVDAALNNDGDHG